MNKHKITALRKLTRSKNYILITDEESMMQLDMTNVDGDINRTITIAQQRASLDQFKRSVEKAIRQFDRKLTNSTRNKKGKKIPVTQG